MNKQKKLHRSTKDSILAGILGGFAEYLKTDSSIIRVVYVLLTLITGFIPGIILYLAMWVIVPEKVE